VVPTSLTFPRHAAVIFTDGIDLNVHLFNICKLLSFDQTFFYSYLLKSDHLSGLVVRVLGYRSGGPGSIPGTTRKKSNGSGTGYTQPCEYN
jgi:hypothetical protein